MADEYGALSVPVYADTKPLAGQIETAATKAGTAAGQQIGSRLGRGLRTVAPIAGQVGKSMAAGLGLATGAAVAFGVKAYHAAEESNKVSAQTAAVLKSTGGAAKVTASQIDRLSASLMAKTGIDDETIKSGQNMLLTFTGIRNEAGKGNDVFNQTTSVLTDMTAALTGGDVSAGSMRSTAKLLGKALNDPLKGMSALTRVGVQFTDAQKRQITQLVESGHRLDAQKIILDELRQKYAGTAAASATAGERLKTAYGEIQEAIGGTVAKAINPALDGFGRLASRVTAAIGPGGRLAPIFNAIGAALGRLIAPLGHLIDLGGQWLDKLDPATVNTVAAAIRRFGPALAAVAAGAAAVTGAGLFTQLPIIGPVISNLLGPLTSLIGKVGGLSGALRFLTGPLGIILALFGTALATSPEFRNQMLQLGRVLLSALMPAFQSVAAAIVSLAPAFTAVARVLGGALAVALQACVPLFVALGAVLKFLAPFLPILVKGFLAIYAAVKLWTGAQLLLNIALDANPIGLVVLAIGALIVVLIAVWQHCTTFRKIVIGAFKAVWDWIKQYWPLLLGIITGPIGIATVLIIKNWDRIKAATRAAWSWIKNFVTGTLGTIIRTVSSAVGSIGARISAGFSRIVTAVRGLVSTVLRHLADLGAGFLKAGGDAVRNLLSGITKGLANIGSWVKSHIVDPVVNAVKHFFGIHSPSAVMEGVGQNVTAGLIQGIAGVNPLDIAKTVFGGLPAALGHIVAKGLVSLVNLPAKAISALGHLGSWFGNLLGGVGGFFGKLFGGGSGVGQWAGLVRTVLAMLGLPATYLGPWLAQMNTESGGNPNAINLTDINAQHGTPSQGLLQTIPSTFAAYAGPFRARGITDPLANIYAAINYALHRYGRLGMLSVIGHGHGYASGGIIGEPVAGFGLRSGSLYSFAERGPELVSPLSGSAPPGLDGAARPPIVINVYPQAGQSETAIAAAVSRRLGWAEATGRAS